MIKRYQISALLAVSSVFLLPDSAVAQTVTAFKTGERTTGMTKQCFYEGLGNAYTRTVSSVALCPLSIKVQAAPKRNQRADPSYSLESRTITAFKTGERTTGMTKQCFYEGLGSAYTKTISSVALCPLSIKVRM